jgi:hypothetical protein
MRAWLPKPVILVVDDVGWWSGSDDSLQNGPYRTGINRSHVPADYQALVDLGRMTGSKPLAAMVLCEWDRSNILRELPSATWMGGDWDNSANVGPQLDEAAAIINGNREHIELLIHGIGHEFWHPDGTFTRAEWCCQKTNKSRPVSEILRHLEFFQKIMDQNNMGSLPKAFIPSAFALVCGEDDDSGVISLLAKHGVNYINQPFGAFSLKSVSRNQLLLVDHGVPVISRGRDNNNWYVIGGTPGMAEDSVTIGTHWPNLLHENPARNQEVVRKWADFMLSLDARPDTMLAHDSAEHRCLVPYFALTRMSCDGKNIELDFSGYLQVMRQHDPQGLFLKVSGCDMLSASPDAEVVRISADAAYSIFRIKPEKQTEKLVLNGCDLI